MTSLAIEAHLKLNLCLKRFKVNGSLWNNNKPHNSTSWMFMDMIVRTLDNETFVSLIECQLVLW